MATNYEDNYGGHTTCCLRISHCYMVGTVKATYEEQMNLTNKLRKIALIGTISISALCTAAVAANAFDPKTNPQEWREMLEHSLDLRAFDGEDWVVAVNATPDEITVICDGKWQMVGNTPYKTLAKNPSSLHPWSITPIHATSDFNGYCTDPGTGLLGKGTFHTYHGTLNGGPGNFTTSTLLYFETGK